MNQHPNEMMAERLWNSIAIADVSQLVEIIDAKAIWVMPGRSPLAGRHEGISAILAFMARVGELTDLLESTLLEVFANDRGAVLRYAIHATRGGRTLDTEHLFMIRVRENRIVEGSFAPFDQDSYDEFWLESELAEKEELASQGNIAMARIVPFRRPTKPDG
jgi:ketosteroid isomerase-like protein